MVFIDLLLDVCDFFFLLLFRSVNDFDNKGEIREKGRRKGRGGIHCLESSYGL